MNQNMVEQNWNVARSKIKAMFGKLTDEELDQIQGDYNELCGHIQKAYGLTREQVEYDIARLS